MHKTHWKRFIPLLKMYEFHPFRDSLTLALSQREREKILMSSFSQGLRPGLYSSRAVGAPKPRSKPVNSYVADFYINFMPYPLPVTIDSIAEKEEISPFQGFPHPDPLPEGEGIRGMIAPANPIEQQPDMLEKKVHNCRMYLK